MAAKGVVSFKVDSELKARIETCAQRLGITPSRLMILAVEAGVAAVEANNYHLVLPLEFQAVQIAVQNPYLKPNHPKSSGSAAA